MIITSELSQIKRLAYDDKKGTDDVALMKACDQFEAIMLNKMLKGLRNTVSKTNLVGGGIGEEMFTDMYDQALSEEAGKTGGVGFGKILYNQLTEKIKSGSAGELNRKAADYMKDLKIQPEQPIDISSGNLTWPVEGRISSRFGMRFHPVLKKEAMHNGLDIATPEGTAVMAAASGQVIFSGKKGGLGNLVEIEHSDGTISRYGHNSKNIVTAGQMVKSGQKIAEVGTTGLSTGPHLHFELIENGKAVDPMAKMVKSTRMMAKTNSKVNYAG